jgi:hypothetical protein
MNRRIGGELDPDAVRAERPIGLLRGPHSVTVGEKMGVWVGFRGEDIFFPATPIIEVTEVDSDKETPHILRFAGVEVEQFELYMAWGKGVEVHCIVNQNRGVIGFTAIGGVNIEPDVDPFFFESPHTK